MYKLLVGLGNPSKQYKNSRHNLGAYLVKKYAQRYKIKLSKKPKLKAKIGLIKQNDINLVLAIPTTYMNLSGHTVAKIKNFYKINPQNIYVAHDDLDIEVGESKIQFNRGPAGHNGIKSIMESLNSQQFWRIRIGIDHPVDNFPTENYVLMSPTKAERDKINQTIDKIIQELTQTAGL